jgi:hypothetical protein
VFTPIRELASKNATMCKFSPISLSRNKLCRYPFGLSLDSISVLA